MALLNFFQNKATLGIDIGSTSIKIAEVSPGASGPHLDNYALFENLAHLERSNAVFQSKTVKIYEEEIASYLKIIYKRAGFKAKRVFASLPAFSSFSTSIEIPMMSEKEVRQTLNFKAKQYIPLPMDSVALDWVKVGERLDDKGVKQQQLFLIAVPKNYLDQYQKIFRLAGLDLESLELEVFSTARLLGNTPEPTLIIDLGARSTLFIVAKNRAPHYISQSDFSSSSLTEAISRSLGINSLRAEGLKREKGLGSFDYEADKELSTLLTPVIDVIISEAKRAKDSYANLHHEDIKRVVLTGGGANLIGLREYIAKSLNLEVAKANSFEGIYYERRLDPILNDLSTELAVSLGLALKPFIE